MRRILGARLLGVVLAVLTGGVLVAAHPGRQVQPAQAAGVGYWHTAHSTTGDTFSVTFASGGATSTQTGHF